MTNLRNFFNSVSGNNRIFTSEDIGSMSPEEFSNNEQAIRNQWGEIGIPSNGELFGSDDVVYVHAYTRGDGTEVRAHYRSKGGGRIGIGTVTGGVSGMGNSVAPDQPTIEEMEKERERMEKESLKILLERSSNSTEGSDINQAITDITDIFNVLGGFVPDGLMGNVGGFLSDYYENLSNILHKNGAPTGAAAQVNNVPNLGDNIQESIYHSIGNFTGSVANSNMDNAIHDMAATKNNPFAKIIARSDIKNAGLNKLLDNIGVPKSSRGSFYNANSVQSKQLSESKQINDFVKNNYEKILKGEIQNAPIHFNGIFGKGLDNRAGIQHAIIHNPRIDNNGNFSGIIVDYYDFVHRTGLNPTNVPNNWGYSMQQRGLLENQFNIYLLYKKI